jgi:hypothetical protein
MANPKLHHFPIKTTDRKASESIEGLCSVMAGDVRSNLSGSEGIDIVVSEKGIAIAAQDAVDENVKYFNEGAGVSVVNSLTTDDPIKLSLKSISTNTPDRITINPGPNSIEVQHNGEQTAHPPITAVFVQGGAYQTSGNISINGLGTSTDTITLSANTTSLDHNEIMDWSTDISIAKFAYKINTDSLINKKINIGVDGDLDAFGYFIPKKSAEWAPITYNLYSYFDQFEYITTTTTIYFSAIDASAVGDFDIRVFFDKVKYGGTNNYDFVIDSSVNDRYHPVQTVISGDGWVDVKWLDGPYTDFLGLSSSFFTVNDGTNDYFADKDNHARFLVNDNDVIKFFVDTLNTSSNNGDLYIRMTKENF